MRRMKNRYGRKGLRKKLEVKNPVYTIGLFTNEAISAIVIA